MVDLEQEKNWLQQSREGDHTAFENLIRSYQLMIHSVTYRMTGSMADAEDLTQETFNVTEFPTSDTTSYLNASSSNIDFLVEGFNLNDFRLAEWAL